MIQFGSTTWTELWGTGWALGTGCSGVAPVWRAARGGEDGADSEGHQSMRAKSSPPHPPACSLTFLPQFPHLLNGEDDTPMWGGGFPGGSAVKNLLQCRRFGFNSLEVSRATHFSVLAWRIPSPGQRSLEGYSPWSCKESDMTEHLNTRVYIGRKCRVSEGYREFENG